MKSDTTSVKVGSKSFAATGTSGTTTPPEADNTVVAIVVIILIVIVVVAVLVVGALRHRQDSAVGNVDKQGKAGGHSSADPAMHGSQMKPKARLKPPALNLAASSVWVVLQDPSSGREYYVNRTTREAGLLYGLCAEA